MIIIAIGKFVVRVPPATHKKLALEAAEEGVSLNRLASAKLCQLGFLPRCDPSGTYYYGSRKKPVIESLPA
jgi:hypothetical protein